MLEFWSIGGDEKNKDYDSIFKFKVDLRFFCIKFIKSEKTLLKKTNTNVCQSV